MVSVSSPLARGVPHGMGRGVAKKRRILLATPPGTLCRTPLARGELGTQAERGDPAFPRDDEGKNETILFDFYNSVFAGGGVGG